MADGSLKQSIKIMLTEFKEDISKQIGELRSDFESFLTEVKQIWTDVKEIRSNFGEVTNNIKEVEQRIHQLEEREVATNSTLKHLLQEQQKMNEKMEYLENKSRQNNIRIYQVKEGAEGGDAVAFIRSLLVERLEIAPDTLHIVTVHRSLTKKPVGEDVTPRSFVVCFLQWNTLQKVLQAAWSKKEIMVGNSQIYFS